MLPSCLLTVILVMSGCREEREREVKEAEERERWRTMSEEERQRWLRLHPKTEAPQQKKKWRFLQVRNQVLELGLERDSAENLLQGAAMR